MINWFYDYVLFFSKVFTILIAISLLFLKTKKVSLKQNKLKIIDWGEDFKNYSITLVNSRYNLKKINQFINNRNNKNYYEDIPVVWLIDFYGDINASYTPILTELITSILSGAKNNDEVVLRLESCGGIIHSYGLAAAQVDRLRKASIKLTICVDKVAASGGYMMACCADKLFAAPFSIIGSIGVVAQVPNINRFLKKHDVDVEILTSGKNKRTLTILGENTNEDKVKFIKELKETHDLFKYYVFNRRPKININKVSKGDIWYGIKAIKEGLIDKVITSEEYLELRSKKAKIFKLVLKKKLSDIISKKIKKTIARFLKLSKIGDI
ncbi:Putative protease SohB [Candidatus Portiera aleyrodidarum]|uniref:Protease sohB n=1 Tax=Candidatus Portiera aleyrodidarum TV TaxID=1297582 RepID=A0A8D3XAR1_9GAMM|nr:protease SohB [Candidatus Portiera aleyrodidarum]AGI27054.1 protease sohB [Candidatus Portiera aleyrodidarum TV]CEI59015.1 Putative protease SohB [Candidatus Portiera aleyrodidarum]